MKFPFGYIPPFYKPKNRPQILIHGDWIHSYKKTWSAVSFSREAIISLLGSAPTFEIYLASPYLHSFIHETIHLSNKELEQADQRLLGFSTSPSPHVQVTAIRLTDKKALTIHSHLSRKGAELLSLLKREKTSFSWYPAVTSIITNINHEQKLSSDMPDNLRIFLDDEMLQVQKQAGQVRFQHLNYLHNDQDFDNRCRIAEQILDKTGDKKLFLKLPFNNNSPGNLNFPLTFLQPPIRSRDIKSITRVQRKRRFSPRILLNRNRVLGLATCVCVLWAGTIQWQLLKMNQQQQERYQTIAVLKQKSRQLNQIALSERKHVRLSAITQTVEQIKTRPFQYLEKLESILPKGVWIQQIVFQENHTLMILLDSEKTELSGLMDGIGKHLGKTSLRSSEEVSLKKVPVQRYTVEVICRTPGDLI